MTIGQLLYELCTHLAQVLSMAAGALMMRWLLNLSTPREDWHLAKQAVEYAYDSIRIPDWRDYVNMARLEQLRERIQWERRHWATATNEYEPTGIIVSTVVTPTDTTRGNGNNDASQ